MYDLTPILSFALTNAELNKKLREHDYGRLEDHLDALNMYKMRMPEVLQPEQQVHLGLLMALRECKVADEASHVLQQGRAKIKPIHQGNNFQSRSYSWESEYSTCPMPPTPWASDEADTVSLPWAMQ